MRTYRELLAVPDVPPLLVSSTLGVAAGVGGGLALATLVYARTGSPLLAATAMFGPAFGHLLGASLLLARADRVPPRAALTALFAASGLLLAVLARPGLPVVAVVAVVLASGVLASLQGAVRWGLLSEVLPAQGYLLGRSVMQVVTGAVQVLANALAALALQVIDPTTLLLVAAALDVVAALVVALGLRSRPARAPGRASLAETWRGNRAIWAVRGVPATYLALWVPNGLVVGAEALFVPYAGTSAGVLFAAGAVGMITGDAVVGRFVPAAWRRSLVTPTRVLLAAPYLVFALDPDLPLAAAVVAVASAGFSAGLLLQEQLLTLTPPTARGQVLGLHSSGMLGMQGLGALAAGALAEAVPTGTAMALVAAASLLVTAALTPALRRPPHAPDVA